MAPLARSPEYGAGSPCRTLAIPSLRRALCTLRRCISILSRRSCGFSFRGTAALRCALWPSRGRLGHTYPRIRCGGALGLVWPDVVVARIIDDGPVPMGPYVYLNALPSRAVTTALCRCSPSQVEAFIETRYYDLRPLETLGSCSERMSWAGTLVYGELWQPVTGKPLDRILRWARM